MRAAALQCLRNVTRAPSLGAPRRTTHQALRFLAAPPRTATRAMATFPSFTTSNFYAGNALNRLSWLRPDSAFLNAALTSPQARFLLLQHLNPLVHGANTGGAEGTLATLSFAEVQAALGASEDGLFGPAHNGLKRPDAISEKDWARATDGLLPTGLCLVFLGVDERGTKSSLPGQVSKSGAGATPDGVPYFALSVTHRAPGHGEESPLQDLEAKLLKNGYDFVDTRTLAQAGSWEASEAALVAQARSLIDWGERQNYCPACARRQYALWGGYKRACASSLAHAHETSADFVRPLLDLDSSAAGGKEDQLIDGRAQCPTTGTLSNFSYPRTDPTVIMGIVSPDGEGILLGRQKKWPPGFYSCLAGFLEPGESLEEAVRREVHEEAGVEVGHVTYHSSQPWPFPANLMMGALGQATTQTIRLDLDNELEDARFFSRAEVLAAIDASANWTLKKHDLGKIDENVAARQAKVDEERKRLGLPPRPANAPARGRQAFQQKDPGSVANVSSLAERSRSRSSERAPRAAFKIPGPTAIAHVLIAAWARGEAHLASTASETSSARGRM